MLVFKKKDNKSPTQPKPKNDRGLVLFETVEDAILAEKVTKRNGILTRLVAPPPSLRKGCDLALEISLIEQAAIESLLRTKVPYVDITPLSGTAELLSIIKITRYDGYTMVKAGNMKLTYEDNSGVVVNTSGGGCPDIPYLHLQLVGKRLEEIPRPRDIGRTLCALMLDRAAEGALEIWEGGKLDVNNRRDFTHP